MYNQLIRRDPTDHTVPIIGDLAKEWEVSSDALKYTFHLHEGVKFHDGAELTSEDVVASYPRIVFPDTYGEGLGSARHGRVHNEGGSKPLHDPAGILFAVGPHLTGSDP